MLVITFHNDGTGNEEIGNYNWEVYLNRKLLDRGELKNHNRSDGWKGLVKLFVKKNFKSSMRKCVICGSEVTSKDPDDELCMLCEGNEQVQHELDRDKE